MTRSSRFSTLLLAGAVQLLAHPALSRAQSPGERDLKAVGSYPLTMPRYRQYLDALVNLAGAAEQDPDVAAALEGTGGISLDQTVKRYDAVPVVRSAIADAGLTTRDFVLTQTAFFQTGMAYALMKQGQLSLDSVVKTAKVSRTNLDFYQKNEVEIKRLTEEYEARVPSLREAEGDSESE